MGLSLLLLPFIFFSLFSLSPLFGALSTPKFLENDTPHIRPKELLTINGILQSNYTSMHASKRPRRGKKCFVYPAFTDKEFDVQLDLIFKYENEKSWIVSQVEFDNEAGFNT